MKRYTGIRRSTMLLAGALALAVACGKEQGEGKRGESEHDDASSTGAAGPQGTGKTIIVEAYSDEKGNYFKPSKVEAHQGDVVRFVLKSGVHNTNFLPDSNAGKTGLPPASDMLQLPDQTYDVKIAFAKGHYYFQCDPHAALGMKGHLEVED
jgi:plastocyanin